MAKATLSRVSTAVALGVSSVLSAMMLRTKPKKPADSMEVAWLSVVDVEISDREDLMFSEADYEVDPLTEAEIYVLYGRQNDAQEVLAAAEAQGRLSPERIAQFWSDQEDAMMARMARNAARKQRGRNPSFTASAAAR